MRKPTNVILLVGSPKGENSTSNSLGTFLIEKLNEKSVTGEKVYLNQSLTSKEKQATLLQRIDKADLILLSFPLYVDCLHSQVIKTLELIEKHEKAQEKPSEKSFVAISNSGFPEALHSKTALEVCRIFAKQVGYAWAGGLAMGGGGIIAGRPLDQLGGMVRNQTKALQIAADALANGDAIPIESIILMGKLGFPSWLYIWMGNRGWKQEARHNIKVKELYNQPYAQ